LSVNPAQSSLIQLNFAGLVADIVADIVRDRCFHPSAAVPVSLRSTSLK
jgi:hypothetical protein